MNATKRKFNALLQGLGTNPHPTSPDDAQTTMTTNTLSSATATTPDSGESLLQKRRRLGLQGATVWGGGVAPAKASPNNVAASRWGSRTESKPKDRSDLPARYSPTDRQELLKRLGTFQELTDWTPKPERVSEIEWAKRGWVCQGKERVRCVLCHKELIVKLNRKEIDGKEVAVLVPSEVEDALVDKYAELIVASHQEDCLWRKRGCDDSLLRLSLASATKGLEALRLRYDELCARKSFLPYEFNLRLPDGLSLDDLLSKLPPTFFTNPAPADDASSGHSPNRVALALAVLGWQGLSNARIGAVPNSASCHTCLRRLGLWMFKSKEVGDNDEILVPAPMDHLDPTREHRFFCPWKSSEAQSQDSTQSDQKTDMPGWKVLLRTIANEAHLQSVYEGRPRTKSRAKQVDGSAPSTPARRPGNVPVTPGESTPGGGGHLDHPGGDMGLAGSDEDEAARETKDKERWARLRKVKSLFESKSGRKLRHPLSRPGTSHSTVSTQDKE